MIKNLTITLSTITHKDKNRKGKVVLYVQNPVLRFGLTPKPSQGDTL